MRKQPITVDLEAYAQYCVLDTTPGEVMVIAGRQTGKSIYHKMMLNHLYGNNLCNEIILPMSPKPKSKYQFSRAKWYTAEFKWEDASTAFTWCTKQFGEMDKKPDAWSRWRTMPGNKIAFRDEKDYVWFTMRWS